MERKIKEFCDKILATRSINEKKAILKEYENDTTIQLFLQFMFDKSIVTGISTKKINKPVNAYSTLEINTLIQAMMYLERNNTGSDVVIANIHNYLKQFREDEEMVDFLKKILTKSLKLGMDATLVNKVIPRCVPVHEIQQAKSLKNVKLKGDEWICLSQKLNGNRGTYIKGEILSRQGKAFNHIEHIVYELDCLNSMYKQPMVFDGEIIRKNVDNVSDNENFRLGTGILNSDSEDKTELSFVIFDLLPLDEFQAGESKDTYKDRMEEMDIIRAYAAKYFKHIEVVPFLYSGYDHSMIKKCLNQMDAEGKEGCMLALDMPYKATRNAGLLKVKSYRDCTLRCIGVELSESDKYKNQVGALICKYKEWDVRVGSGLSEGERVEYASHPEKIVNQLVDVKYKDVSKNKGGEESLQFPVFLGIRQDKVTPDF